jgi:hypothetical protein
VFCRVVVVMIELRMYVHSCSNYNFFESGITSRAMVLEGLTEEGVGKEERMAFQVRLFLL